MAQFPDARDDALLQRLHEDFLDSVDEELELELDDARLDGDGGADGRLRAEVEITEQLGPETIAYVRVAGLETVELGERPVELAGALAVRLDPRTHARPGGSLELGVDLDQIHLFDAETGASLLR